MAMPCSLLRQTEDGSIGARITNAATPEIVAMIASSAGGGTGWASTASFSTPTASPKMASAAPRSCQGWTAAGCRSP